MKTLYIECNMGAAGDMLMAALLELSPKPEAFIEKMNTLGIPDVKISSHPAVKCGITGTGITVTVCGAEEVSADVPVGQMPNHGQHDHDFDNVIITHAADCAYGSEHKHDYDHEHGHDHRHSHSAHESALHEAKHGDLDHDHDYDKDINLAHHHSHLSDITEIIGTLEISEKAKADALAVYGLIAEAESAVHGVPVTQIHFHEVGTMDAVADIVGVCLLMEELGVQKIVASPVHVGSGQVRCAHGILPVPAPATAHILRGVPCYGGNIVGELCTPTGAALLKHFVSAFDAMPVMTSEKIGYGMGKKDFSSANCVRVFLGET